MKLVVALAIACSSAAKISSLSPEERSKLQEELAEWTKEFGDVARDQGFLPPANESLDEEDQLERLFNTKNAVAQARLDNPEAEFDFRNPMALMTDEEFKKYVSVSFDEGAPGLLRGTDEKVNIETPTNVAAASVDWTSSSCIPAVRNQGRCGSCWAFSALGVAASAHCIKTGHLLTLSEQQVTSCSTNGGSQGCNGGWPWYAIDWTTTGVCLDSAWPYTSGSSGQTGSCNKQCTKQKLAIGKSVRVSGESSLDRAVTKQPVSVTVAAGNSVWRNYRSGVISQCPRAQSDHAVIAEGYDSGSYKVRNSWGAGWGERGYIRLKRGAGGQGTCNVAGAVSFPRI